MKAWFIIATVAFSCMFTAIANAESTNMQRSFAKQELDSNIGINSYSNPDSIPRLQPKSVTGTNICRIFSDNSILEDDLIEAPPPVRTLYDGNPEQFTSLDVPETMFYQQLGLTQSRDGSHVCLAKDPINSRRQFTIFKVKKINNVLVISTFLNSGKFMTGQENAATKLFMEMIRFYTNIPDTYHQSIRNYLEDFYLRMLDGRIVPSSDRAYPIDEPTASVIIYHALNGPIPGTGISLNIPLE